MSEKNSLPGPHNVIDVRLANGLRALIYENFAAPVVIVDAYAPGGAIHESPEQAGLAHLTAAMLRRGAESHDFDAINEAVEAVGASFSFGAGRHVLSFGGRCLPDHFPLVLDLLAESLTRPSFDRGQLEQIRARFLTSLQERAHNTRAMASLRFRELLYGAHPYAQALSGYEDTVATLSRDDLVAFYRRCVSPAGGIIVVAGAVPAAEAIALLERTVGQWRQPHADPDRRTLPAPALVQTLTSALTLAGKSQSDLIMGWPGIPRRHPDYFPMLLANSILGSFGMGGRIGLNVREKQGMAYYAHSTFGANQGAGTWYAAAGVNPANVVQTIASIRHEIERIVTEPVSAEELADVKANLSGALPLRLETNNGIAGNLLSAAWYDLGLDYLLGYADQVNAVTRADILGVAQTYLDPDRFVLSTAGPQEPLK